MCEQNLNKCSAITLIRVTRTQSLYDTQSFIYYVSWNCSNSLCLLSDLVPDVMAGTPSIKEGVDVRQ